MAKPTFEEALTALAAQQRQGLKEHPSPDELLAYHSRQLESAPKESMQDHLSVCGECARMVLSLGLNPNPETGRKILSISHQEVDSGWKMLEDALNEPKHPPPARPLFHQLRFAYSIAALLLFGVVGLTAWTITNREPMIRINVPHRALGAQTDQTRGAVEPELVLPANGQTYYLLLQSTDTVDYPGYRIEVIDRGTSRIWWSSNEISPLPDGDFSLEFNQLPRPGSYRIVLTGLSGDEEVELARYHLTVEEAN